ncbi:MAG: hypothetical protein IPM94_16120 [bacterium]|nr:hypothetical protein [bacterium]
MLGHMTSPGRIKLMWDYGCWPLWQHDGQIYDNIDPASLPLSAPTLTRLQAWAAIPDAKLAAVEYPPDMKWSEGERQAFEVEGRELWLIICRELGEGYDVSYHNRQAGPACAAEDDAVT